MNRLFTLLTLSFAMIVCASSASAAPKVYVVTLSQQFGILDLGDGKFEAIGNPAADSLAELVWSDGSLYTLTISGSDVGSLAKINPATGEVTDIGPTGLGFNAFSLAGVRGRLYATDFSNNLYSIDRRTGAATLIKNTVMPPDPTVPFTYNSDGTFNVCDESFYGVGGEIFATFDSFAIDPNNIQITPVKVDPALYEIDPETGVTIRVASTDLKLSASVKVHGRFYAFRGVLTGFANGFPQAYSQIVRLDLATGKTIGLANVDPSLGLILGAAPVRDQGEEAEEEFARTDESGR